SSGFCLQDVAPDRAESGLNPGVHRLQRNGPGRDSCVRGSAADQTDPDRTGHALKGKHRDSFCAYQPVAFWLSDSLSERNIAQGVASAGIRLRSEIPGQPRLGLLVAAGEGIQRRLRLRPEGVDASPYTPGQRNHFRHRRWRPDARGPGAVRASLAGADRFAHRQGLCLVLPLQPGLTMPTVVLILLVTLCTISSQLILKSGVNSLVAVLKTEGVVPFLFAAATSPKVLTALSIQGAGYVVWLFVLAQSKLSVAFATSGSFFYLVMAAASWLVFGERLTAVQWAGLVLISCGVMLVSNGAQPLQS